MCLVLFSYDEHAATPLIVAANRDEFFARPTAAASYWNDHSDLLAGRDLVAGGTWIGITRTGRFATITNVREPHITVDNPLSRGDLTLDFLTSNISPEAYLKSIQAKQHRYSGFNLLVGDISENQRELRYFSNRKEGIHRLSSGVYGLSNHLLNSPWPKVSAGKDYLHSTIARTTNEKDLHSSLREFLENPLLANDDILPSTGVSYEREKALSAAFISLPDYGTRTSTVLTVSDSEILFSEKNYLDSDNQQIRTQANAGTLENNDDFQLFRIKKSIPMAKAI